jgi:hypothetical protein
MKIFLIEFIYYGDLIDVPGGIGYRLTDLWVRR